MKNQIIAGITIITSVALCAAVWHRSSENKVIPVTQEKPTISADLAATQEEPLHIIFSADTTSPEPAETEESTAEKKQASSQADEAVLEPVATGTPEPMSPPSSAPKTAASSAPPSSDPKSGTIAVIDGEPHIWIPGFGWIEYSGKPNVGIVAEDMYENGNKVGSMGGEEPQDSNTSSPPTEQSESTGDEIHIVFVETPEKNSTPPPYKPDTTCPQNLIPRE